jgi:hypothetical protein
MLLNIVLISKKLLTRAKIQKIFLFCALIFLKISAQNKNLKPVVEKYVLFLEVWYCCVP